MDILYCASTKCQPHIEEFRQGSSAFVTDSLHMGTIQKDPTHVLGENDTFQPIRTCSCLLYCHTMNTLEQSEKRAWRFFKLWRAKPTYCPALHKNVYKSLRAWWHIKATRSTIKRPTTDLVHRYDLLPSAQIVINDGVLIEKRSQHGQIFYALEHTIDSRHIRVILVEDKTQKLWFLSITEKNKKTAPLTLP